MLIHTPPHTLITHLTSHTLITHTSHMPYTHPLHIPHISHTPSSHTPHTCLTHTLITHLTSHTHPHTCLTHTQGVVGTERSLKTALVSLFVEGVLELEGDEKGENLVATCWTGTVQCFSHRGSLQPSQGISWGRGWEGGGCNEQMRSAS